MDHYIYFQILPDAEFKASVLMNALYNKLHKVLVKLGSNDIGISFPGYMEDKGLGKSIRLHGKQARLEILMSANWLQGMKDYVRHGEISPVPVKVQHVIFSRVQVKSNAERIRRRQMRRHNMSEQEALLKFPDSDEKSLNLPFLTARSHTTQQTFRLFVKKENVAEQTAGHFNAYGLSSEASVPLF